MATRTRNKASPRWELQQALRDLEGVQGRLQRLMEEWEAHPAGATSTAALVMSRAVYDEIRHTVGRLPAEQGGLLGGRNGMVTHFCFDRTAHRTGATYSPDHERLNRLLQEDWNLRGIRLQGFAHSHPRGIARPSGGDLVYARRILEHNPHLDRLLLPIVLTEPDTGRFELFPFVALRNGEEVKVVEVPLDLRDEQVLIPFSPTETFRRVRGAYDLDRLARSRIIAVGTGGAAGFIEDLARAGVGQFVLVDPDVVSETNLATQQVYRRDIGRPKGGMPGRAHLGHQPRRRGHGPPRAAG